MLGDPRHSHPWLHASARGSRASAGRDGVWRRFCRVLALTAPVGDQERSWVPCCIWARSAVHSKHHKYWKDSLKLLRIHSETL